MNAFSAREFLTRIKFDVVIRRYSIHFHFPNEILVALENLNRTLPECAFLETPHSNYYGCFVLLTCRIPNFDSSHCVVKLYPAVMKSLYFLCAFFPTFVTAFVAQRFATSTNSWRKNINDISSTDNNKHILRAQDQKEVSIYLNPELDDERVAALFAWVSRAFAGEPAYNNLMLAIAAIFGNLPDDSQPVEMAKEALKLLPPEEKTVGDPISVDEREDNSLGAMGAAQWTGRWKTRPHALLELKNITTVDDWVGTLPRGCKRTIKKALAQNFTVVTKPILGNEPAPHSSLAHFRCVIEHEVRLLKNMYGEDAFFDALAEGVSRYVGTTRMTGDIREYRSESGKVIAIAHEVSVEYFYD